MTREEIKDFCDMKAQLEPENEDIFKAIVKALEQDPFINKPCVSSGVCEHDKNKVLDMIRTEIKQNTYPIVHGCNSHELGMTLYGILQVIDKYMGENEDKG